MSADTRVTQPTHVSPTADADYCDDMRFVADYIKDVADAYDFSSQYYLHGDDVDMYVWRAYQKRVASLRKILNSFEWL